MINTGRPKVYLAGTISGSTYGEANSWRESAVKQLNEWNIDGASPMRWKEHLSDEDDLHKLGYNKNVMSTQKGIMTRDFWDVHTCDVMLVNLLDSKIVSIGTVMEMAWAYKRRIPVVVVMEEGNIHEHAMLNETICYRVGSVEEGLTVVRKILDYSV